MIYTSIVDFQKLYITGIQKIAFHLTHVHILGTYYCGNTHHEALKHCTDSQDELCCCEYTERVVASFSH